MQHFSEEEEDFGGWVKFLDVVIVIIGWIYFSAWSFSFYPQIFLNITNKSKNIFV